MKCLGLSCLGFSFKRKKRNKKKAILPLIKWNFKRKWSSVPNLTKVDEEEDKKVMINELRKSVLSLNFDERKEKRQDFSKVLQTLWLNSSRQLSCKSQSPQKIYVKYIAHATTEKSNKFTTNNNVIEAPSSCTSSSDIMSDASNMDASNMTENAMDMQANYLNDTNSVVNEPVDLETSLDLLSDAVDYIDDILLSNQQTQALPYQPAPKKSLSLTQVTDERFPVNLRPRNRAPHSTTNFHSERNHAKGDFLASASESHSEMYLTPCEYIESTPSLEKKSFMRSTISCKLKQTESKTKIYTPEIDPRLSHLTLYDND